MTGPTTATDDARYWAFISYSHQDEIWARWLHRALETYRVPRRLVGRPLRGETIPRRLFPVFRDREELPSAHELGAVLQRALDGSRNLIVICSPRSAASRWVNEEIRRFRAQGGGDRIYCLIVDGEPHAADPAQECFAPALREAGFEPIAADAREGKDGKADALLKLVAGLIGVGLDELRQRDRQRRFWQRVQSSVAAALLLTLLAGGLKAWQSDREARAQEVRLDRLVESGRRELLDGQQTRAAVYLAEAYRLGRTETPVRFMLAQAMQPVDALLPAKIEHGGSDVRAAAFSADGTQIAVAIADGKGPSLAIFEAGSGRPIARFAESKPYARQLRFTPDGRQLLLVGYATEDDRGAETLVFDLSEKRLQYRLPGEAGRLSDPGDATLARLVTVHPTEVVVWRTADGAAVERIPVPQGAQAAALDRDGARVAIARGDGAVELRPLGGRRAERMLKTGVHRSVSGLRFGSDNQFLTAVSLRGDIRLWDLRDGSLRLSFAADQTRVSAIQVGSRSNRLLTVGWNGYKVWDLNRGTLLFALPMVLRGSSSADLSPDGERLVIADASSSIAEIWDVESQQRLMRLDYHAARVRFVATDASGMRLLTASADGTARVWRTDGRLRWSRRSSDADRAGSWALDKTRGQVYSTISAMAPDSHPERRPGYARSHVQAYDLLTGQAAAPWPSHPVALLASTMTPDGRMLATAGSDGRVALSRTPGGEPVSSAQVFPVAVARLRMSPGGAQLLAIAEAQDGVAPAPRLLSVPDLKVIAELAMPEVVRAAAFSADGRLLATAGDKGLVKIWDASTGAALRTLRLHAVPVYALQFSRDGRQLVTADDDGKVYVVDPDSGALLRELKDAALRYPNLVVFDDSAERIALGDWSGNVWVWNPDGRLNALAAHNSSAWWVSFVAEGRLLLSSGTDGRLFAWNPDAGELLGTLSLHGESIRSQEVDESRGVVVTLDDAGLLRAWRYGLEQRTPDQLEARFACTVPWVVEGQILRRREVVSQDCPQ